MTHEYTILTGGRILASDEPAGTSADDRAATAIAWAADTVLAVGSDEAVRAVSRGDSRFHDLAGAVVRPLGDGWLEPGSRADFTVLDGPGWAPGGQTRRIAVVRGGLVVEGRLP